MLLAAALNRGAALASRGLLSPTRFPTRSITRCTTRYTSHYTARLRHTSTGFRKPHLAFRFPAPFLRLVEGDVAAHPTLSTTVPPIAHHDAAPQGVGPLHRLSLQL